MMDIFLAAGHRDSIAAALSWCARLIALFALLGSSAFAQPSYDDEQTNEGWAWGQIKQGKPADFNERCGTRPLVAGDDSETRWGDECRRLAGGFLADVLTQEPLLKTIPFAGVNIIGARIEGPLDLHHAKLDRAILIGQSRVENNVDLNGTRTDSDLGFVASRVAGEFDAGQFQGALSLQLSDTLFKQKVVLNSAKVDRDVDMDGSAVVGTLHANGLQVGGDLSLTSTDRYSPSFNDVELDSARITGSISMSAATVGADLSAASLHVGGHLTMGRGAHFKNVNLVAAKITGNVLFGGTFTEVLNAVSMQVGANLSLRSLGPNKASFNVVNLTITNIGGNVDISGVTFVGPLDANAMQVGANLLMHSTNDGIDRFKAVDLGIAKIAGTFSIQGAIFEGKFNGYGIRVGSELRIGAFKEQKAIFETVNLASAAIAGRFQIDSAAFEAELDANSIKIDSHLSMTSSQSKNTFSLENAKITGNLTATDMAFDGKLNAVLLNVGGNVFFPNTVCAEPVDMALAQIGGSLDIRGATFADLRLSGATVAAQFVVGSASNIFKPARWRRKDGGAGALKLYNTRVGNLVDADNAWPSAGNLGLEGFAFTRLGGFDGLSAADMRRRGMDWWDNWVRRDTAYSATAYEQLAGALVLAGQRGAADDIRFLGRVRQREAEAGWGQWMLSGFLQYVAGFGIGTYTFRVLHWVALITLAGALYLWTSVAAARAHGPVWCVGASFTRLLPAIEANKEFTDFFNDPDRQRLTATQSFVFSAVRIVGWVLGIILLAAVTGLTQKG